MPGSERERLINQYQAAVQAYSDAVRRLVGLTGTEFRKAHEEAEQLRESSEQHRLVVGKVERLTARR